MDKSLSPTNITGLLNEVRDAVQNGAQKIAAFDADGTLWDTDIGESFFKFQIENKVISDLPKDPWNHYQNWHEREPEKAYLWLAQISKGVPITTVREWAKSAVNKNSPLPIFKHMASLIRGLKDLGVNVYIVTASVKWAVEPAAELLGIPEENVLGIETEVHGGIVTDKQKGPITWRAGKSEALRIRTRDKRPVLAAGNTLGDLDLIASATHFPIAHVSVSSDRSIYKTERDLLTFAKERGWYYLDV